MYRYATSSQFDSNRLPHIALVGPPILITMAFCFVMVLMQSPRTSVNNTTEPVSTQAPLITTTQQPELPSLLAPALPALSTLDDGSAGSGNPTQTSTPQPAASSDTRLQAASSMRQSQANNLRPLLNINKR